jgi:hypothetical protein
MPNVAMPNAGKSRIRGTALSVLGVADPAD